MLDDEDEDNGAGEEAGGPAAQGEEVGGGAAGEAGLRGGHDLDAGLDEELRGAAARFEEELAKREADAEQSGPRCPLLTR